LVKLNEGLAAVLEETLKRLDGIAGRQTGS
jgi:hypothetical protein